MRGVQLVNGSLTIMHVRLERLSGILDVFRKRPLCLGFCVVLDADDVILTVAAGVYLSQSLFEY